MRLCELISKTRFGFDQNQWLSLALMNVSSIALLSLFERFPHLCMFVTLCVIHNELHYISCTWSLSLDHKTVRIYLLQTELRYISRT